MVEAAMVAAVMAKVEADIVEGPGLLAAATAAVRGVDVRLSTTQRWITRPLFGR